jgi:exodeoxyribonuclease V beta subunit
MEEFTIDLPLQRGTTLLEASAGTGKTYSIVSLFLRLIAEQEVKVDQILVVTFTRAATAELRDRLRQRLIEGYRALEAAAEEEPHADHDDPLLAVLLKDRQSRRQRAARLRAAAEGFDEAAVFTIHGFCQRMLQANAFESGAELDTDLTGDAAELLQEVVDDFMTRQLRDTTPEWYHYLGECGITADQLLKLAKIVEENPDIDILPPHASPAGADLLDRWRQAVAQFQSLWESGEGKASLVADARGNKELPKYGTLARYLEKSLFHEAMPPKAKYPADKPKWTHSFSQQWVNEQLDRAGVQPFHHPVLAAYDELLAVASDVQNAFNVAFVEHLRQELPRRKQERHLQTYNDLLHRLRRGLRQEEALPQAERSLRQAIRRQYQAALIDEFQDTDQTQWDIFHTVFGDGQRWLYLIGDPKQAIYSFRGADVFAYLGAKAAATAGQLTLTTNWRSDGPLVQAVEHLFRRPNAFAEAGIDFISVTAAPKNEAPGLVFAPPESPPRSGRPPLEVVFLQREAPVSADGEEQPPPPWSRTELSNELPHLVARDIAQLLASGAAISRENAGSHEKARPLGPSDIAVLTTSNAQAQAQQSALVDAGIPAVIFRAGSVFATDQALWLQRLLDALADPAHTGRATAALATPLFGLAAVTLASMDERAWEAWVNLLEQWQRRWLRHGFAAAWRGSGGILNSRSAEQPAALDQLWQGSDIVSRLLAQPRGERMVTNLMHLAELLHLAETEQDLAPAGLAAWLRSQRLASASDQEDTELRLESDDDAVQVVTIHRSKGLQYPVVYCPYLWDLTADRGLRGGRYLRFHDRQRNNALTLDLHLNNVWPPKIHHLEAARLERQAENLRLLYVAVTRAQHRCTLYWGHFKGAEDSALGYLLHPDSATTPGEATADTLLPELQTWGAAAAGNVEVRPLLLGRTGSGPHLPRTQDPPTKLHRRIFERPFFDSAWRRGSYSSLVRSAQTAGATTGGAPTDLGTVDGGPLAEGQDYDAPPAAAPIAGLPAVALSDHREVPLSAFPGGTEAGTMFHHLFEVSDFAWADGRQQLANETSRHLTRYGFPADQWADQVTDAISSVLQTPLGSTMEREGKELCLAQIDRRERLDELSFDLPVAGGYEAQAGTLTGQALQAAFTQHRPPDEVLGESYLQHLGQLSQAPPLRGFLTGSIDLVFRAPVNGRPQWFIADYKSNRLGAARPEASRVSDYHHQALCHEMEHHHYYLQYHFYALALHRFLRWRLGEGYDWERDVGGVFYLFFRGMVGADTPRDEKGRVAGVFFDKPPLPLIRHLSELMTQGATP